MIFASLIALVLPIKVAVVILLVLLHLQLNLKPNGMTVRFLVLVHVILMTL